MDHHHKLTLLSCTRRDQLPRVIRAGSTSNKSKMLLHKLQLQKLKMISWLMSTRFHKRVPNRKAIQTTSLVLTEAAQRPTWAVILDVQVAEMLPSRADAEWSDLLAPRTISALRTSSIRPWHRSTKEKIESFTHFTIREMLDLRIWWLETRLTLAI